MSIQALYTACTGMNSMQAKLDVIANNLANAQTTGFKADRPNFEDLFYRQEKYPGSQDSSGAYTPTGIATGTGSRVQSTQSNFTQGSLQQTGNSLDVAIQGQGFFQIKDPSGTIYYSRAGNFSQNSQGQIVMGSANIGRLLEPAITIPHDATNISISTAGVVSYQVPSKPNSATSGHHPVGQFHQPPGPAEDRRKPVPGNRGLGRGDDRRPRRATGWDPHSKARWNSRTSIPSVR